MTPDEARLLRIAATVRDKRLQDLAAATAACEATRAGLAALGAHGKESGLSPWEAAFAIERHDLWLMQRRAALNLQLARQMAEWESLHAEARLAFGRAQALEGVLSRR
jgi:hypothetical protein